MNNIHYSVQNKSYSQILYSKHYLCTVFTLFYLQGGLTQLLINSLVTEVQGRSVAWRYYPPYSANLATFTSHSLNPWHNALFFHSLTPTFSRVQIRHLTGTCLYVSDWRLWNYGVSEQNISLQKGFHINRPVSKNQNIHSSTYLSFLINLEHFTKGCKY